MENPCPASGACQTAGRAAVGVEHEFFWLTLFGLLISDQLTAKDDPLKGWIAGFLGLAVAMVGQEKLYTTDRFIYGFTEMQSGVNLIPPWWGHLGSPK